MNWEALGALGEIVGAVAVVVTLVYLARQIRASNRAAREQALQELLDRMQLQMDQITRSGDFAEVFAKGAADFSSLSTGEQMRLRGFFWQTVLNWQRFHHFEESQDVEPWIVHTFHSLRSDLVAAPGFRSWFEERQGWVDPDFRRVLKSEMDAREETLFVPTPD